MGFAEFKYGLMGSGCRQWIDDQSRQQVFQYLAMHFAPVASTYCGMAHSARSTSGLPTDSHPIRERLDVQSLADLEYLAGLRCLCPDI